MDILKKHILKLNHNSAEFPQLTMKISNEIKQQDFQVDIYILLKKYKDSIDRCNQKIWDFSKKLSNEFEMIHVGTKKASKNHNLGIANYDPISRSYFKWCMKYTS